MAYSTTFPPVSGQAEVVSWSKDSIFIRWRFDDDLQRGYDGYMIRYQAVGSSVIQLTRLLDPTTSAFDITQLHENTNYDICVLRMRTSGIPINSGGLLLPAMSSLLSPTSPPMDTVAKACVKGTTSTDSLSVALGSTFGAFLALGLIVALVFVAKWQHVRRAKKRLEALEGALASAAELDDIEDVFRGEGEMMAVESGTLVPFVSDDKGRTLLNDGQPPTAAGDGASRSHLNCSLPSVPPAQNDNEDMSDTSSPPLESPVVMSYDLDTVPHDGRRRSGVVYAVTGAEITTTSADMATDDKHRETSEAAVSTSTTVSNKSRNSIETVHVADHVVEMAADNNR